MTKTDTATLTPVTLRLTRTFAAPPRAVFRAWTEPKALAQWMGPEGVTARKVKIDLRPGGHFSLEMHDSQGGLHPLSGVYREIAPPRRLVFTWIWGAGEIKGVEMLVTVELAESKNGGTELTLTHERLPSVTARDHHEHGWAGSLDRLGRFVEK